MKIGVIFSACWLLSCLVFVVKCEETSEKGSCVVADVPEFGGYRVYLYPENATTDLLSSSAKQPNGTVIRYYCDKGMSMEGDPVRACLDSKWNGTVPSCVRNIVSFSDLIYNEPKMTDDDLSTFTMMNYTFHYTGRDKVHALKFDLYEDFVLEDIRLIVKYCVEGQQLNVTVKGDNETYTKLNLTLESISGMYNPCEYRIKAYDVKKQPFVARSVELSNVPDIGMLFVNPEELIIPMEIHLTTNSKEAGTVTDYRCAAAAEGKNNIQKSWSDGHRCYYMANFVTTNQGAERFCANFAKNSSLMRVYSDKFLGIMRQYIKQHYNYESVNKEFWIGGKYHDKENVWKWDNNQEVITKYPELMQNVSLEKTCLGLLYSTDYTPAALFCSRKSFPICQTEVAACSSPPGAFDRLRSGVSYIPHGAVHSINTRVNDEKYDTSVLTCHRGEWRTLEEVEKEKREEKERKEDEAKRKKEEKRKEEERKEEEERRKEEEAENVKSESQASSTGIIVAVLVILLVIAVGGVVFAYKPQMCNRLRTTMTRNRMM